MYIFTYNNYCYVVAIKNGDEILLGRNSDFLIEIEKLCDSPYYRLDNGYSFIGNTMVMIEVENVFKLLKGDYGLTCQYDRRKGMDTIWSSIYDLKRKNIYICEGNSKRKKFKLDRRLKFNY